MPGRLMEQQGAVGSQDLRKDRSQSQERHLSQKRDFAQMQGTAHTDGIANGQPTANGVTGQQQAPPTTNGHAFGQAPAVSSLPTPPPLDQSWRSSAANVPMGLLLGRVAQQCYGDMDNTINAMRDMPPPQPPAGNGVMPHINDPSRESVDRKRVLMDWASAQRDRFIKALVLFDWSRSEHDMAKLVDIKVWQEKQAMSQTAAIRYIGDIKHATVRAKMPNPNIEDAMELLATGKSSKWPDLAWIALKKLSAKQLLATINNMNVALHVRLSLHEELPPHFCNYSTGDGRATFRVSGEFEVDLSVANEDPTSQFYIIDLRFTFSPMPSISDDGLRNVLEERVNGALSSGGLLGCYDFLHNFVLTHKINILRSQAAALSHEKWFGCLVTATVRRVLAVQYWKDQAGRKSWVEFGISTGKSRHRSSRRAQTAQLSVRWFRHGQEVQDDNIEIDWNNLDLDAIMAQITAKHASWILSTIQKRIQTHAGADSSVTTELSTSVSSAEGCKLRLSMPGLRAPVVLQLHPVTGLMTISTRSRDAATAERNFNRDITADNSASLAQLLCRTVQDRVRRALTSSSWRLADLSGSGSPPNSKALFGPGIVRFDILVCGRGWGDWALCTTYSLSGQKWWAVQLKHSVEQGRTVKTIAHTLVIKVPAMGTCRADFLRIQRLAEAEISFAVLAHDLKTNDIAHHIDHVSEPEGTAASSIPKEGGTAAVYIRLTHKDMKSSAAAYSQVLGLTNWIRIAYQGIVDTKDEKAQVRHDIRLTVESGKLKHLHHHLTMSETRDPDIAMSGSGGLALSLRTPFGEPYVQCIIALLDRCVELNIALSAAPKLEFTCTTVGLQKLAFKYGTLRQYSATLITTGSHTLLKLSPSNNPHQRVHVLLETLYNKTVEHKFWAIALMMSALQPLLEAFGTLETAHLPQRTVSIHSHDISRHVIEYRAPLVSCRFKVSLHWFKEQGRREHRFNITPHQKESVDLPAGFSDALEELSKNCGSPAEGWFGNHNGGYTTHAKGLQIVLQRLDDFVRKSGQVGDATTGKLEKQESPAPDAKPLLDRNPSQQNVPVQQTAPTQQKVNTQTEPKAQQKPQQTHGPQNKTTSQTSKQQHSKSSKVKQEVIELD